MARPKNTRPRKCECGTCNVCTTRERVLRWQRDNPEKTSAKRQRSRERNAARYREQRREWRRRNLTQFKAREALSHAVRSGKIVKPERCERCDEPTESRQLHGHHHDHSQPLDVEWLCVSCHAAEHAEQAA